MGFNPFGEESDSLHAWKERYKQQQFQVQTLQSQLSEVKTKLEQLQFKYEEISKQLRDREEELSSARQEVKVSRELMKDKESKILDLETKVQMDKLGRLEQENQQLHDKVDELQGMINRGATSVQSQTSYSEPSQITISLIPLMLREFDPSNHSY